MFIIHLFLNNSRRNNFCYYSENPSQLVVSFSTRWFTQRATHSEVIYTTKPEDFEATIWDSRYDVLDILHISEHVDRIVRRLRPELTKTPKTNNLVVASFVTSQTRLRLYHFIEQVEADPKYCRLLYSKQTQSFMPEKKTQLVESKKENNSET